MVRLELSLIKFDQRRRNRAWLLKSFCHYAATRKGLNEKNKILVLIVGSVTVAIISLH